MIPFILRPLRRRERPRDCAGEEVAGPGEEGGGDITAGLGEGGGESPLSLSYRSLSSSQSDSGSSSGREVAKRAAGVSFRFTMGWRGILPAMEGDDGPGEWVLEEAGGGREAWRLASPVCFQYTHFFAGEWDGAEGGEDAEWSGGCCFDLHQGGVDMSRTRWSGLEHILDDCTKKFVRKWIG